MATYKSTGVPILTARTQAIQSRLSTPPDPPAKPALTRKVTLPDKEETNSAGRTNVDAGRTPGQGTGSGAALLRTALAAGQYGSINSRINVSRIQTGSMTEKAAEARAAQAMLQGSYAPSHIIKNTGLEAKASFYEAMGRYSGGISLSQNVKNVFSAGGSIVSGKIQGELASRDDLGSQVAGQTIVTAKAVYTGARVAQTASPVVINTIKNLPSSTVKTAKGIANVSKGVMDVTITTGRAVGTLAKTARIMSSGFIPFNAKFTKNVLLNQAKISGLLHTVTSQRIISGVKQIQSRVKQIRTAGIQGAKKIQTSAEAVANAGKYSYSLIRGMANGTVMSSFVAHQVLLKAGTIARKAGYGGLNLAGLGVKLAGQGVARGAVKGSIWAFKGGLPKAGKVADTLSMGLSGVLSSSDDIMLQGTGNAVMLTNYGIKTGITAARLMGRGVKTSAKGTTGAVKGIYRVGSFLRQNGLRAAWVRARNMAAVQAVNAGKSVVSVILNLIKAAGQKVIAPLILIAVSVSVIMSILAAPAAAVGGIFSGLFDTDGEDGTYTETDIRTYITDPSNGIPAKRTAYISGLSVYLQEQLKESGGSYDYVRFKTNASDDLIEPTVAEISGVVYAENELANIIQPVFNAVILQKYDLAPKAAQAKSTLTGIFNKLFRRDEVTTVEYCGDGVTDTDGLIHADITSCPNHSELYFHEDDLSVGLSSCDYYYYICNGHKGSQDCGKEGHTHNSSCNNNYKYCYTCGAAKDCTLPGHDVRNETSLGCTKAEHTHGEWNSESDSGCYVTDYHPGNLSAACGNSTKHKGCIGYYVCNGHNILTVTLSIDGLYEILNEYFQQPIDKLSNKAARTEDEDRELSSLMDAYEICLEYVSQVAKEYGGGLTMEDLSGVQWVNGSRVGNQAVIDIALAQAGQVGGQPFWSWYGFSSRVEWCATFVSWCMNQTGHSEVRFASCEYGGLPYFKGAGRWANGGYTNLVAGDVIFFDWNGDGKAQHTGLVIGTDGTYVYTIEGNSGDTVRTKKYALNSSVILGYGLMNY